MTARSTGAPAACGWLPGRDALLQTLQQRLAALPAGRLGALAVINLCGFREINVGFGHSAGDQVLAAVAASLGEALRSEDRLFHIGNDEFAVLLHDLRHQGIVRLAADRLRASTQLNLHLQGKMVPVRSRIGMALYPEHGQEAAELLRNADAALAAARLAGADCRIYDPELDRRSVASLALRGDLEEAIREGGLELNLQPQIDLRSNRLSGAEALARWPHEKRGLVPPDVFIPIAEQSGLIDSLTFWSLNAALRQCSLYRERYAEVAVAVNLSARVLHDPEVVPLIEQAMKIWNTEPGSLILEITESAMMEDPKAAMEALQALAGIGVTLSIDDFGTGYSSLAYLRDLPVKELKIDKTFVQRMATQPADAALVRSVVDLAHNFGIEVVAEGVEDEPSLDLLRTMGCDYAQGFWIARPMPADEVLEWIGSTRWAR
ncbi:bifunctional diguanylate cyclase/phosphodiesterase [Thiohalobacter sp. IOR34]|uniref:putative bifunctional diguanylate cyclase/phosphodiesterase n=1 Tax=Thiohalobacter sp. IOR34 TaxID=3057176 RepID=UPI0025B07B33|nr:bifunctional diguanylate cyclase/phosphodiesterase [Thiohalobacter sp. IOR34]WJW75422.1 bifunctional diguanylate cyclase/phosphodiesterase [Thiohalobacter sp. IOR34]